jgi:two-component system response regulator MprA
VRCTFADILTIEGYDVETATDGLDALAVLASSCFDVVATDFQMPRMNGLALAVQMRARSIDTPIVLLTGSNGARELAEEMDAVAYIRKPAEMAEIVITIRRVTKSGTCFVAATSAR